MESYKNLIKIKLIEAAVATSIDAFLAIVGMCIFFVTMFADNSFGFGKFFFYTWVLFTMATLNALFAVSNFLEKKFLKKVTDNLITFSAIRKKMSIITYSQIVIDAIAILIFFIVVIAALVNWISNGVWESVVVAFIFGGVFEVFSIVSLIENFICVKRINAIF